MPENNGNYRILIQDKRLENIEQSVKVINHEMGEVQKSVIGIQKDIGYLRDTIKRIDKMGWLVLALMIAATVKIMFF